MLHRLYYLKKNITKLTVCGEGYVSFSSVFELPFIVKVRTCDANFSNFGTFYKISVILINDVNIFQNQIGYYYITSSTTHCNKNTDNSFAKLGPYVFLSHHTRITAVFLLAGDVGGRIGLQLQCLMYRNCLAPCTALLIRLIHVLLPRPTTMKLLNLL